MSCCRAREQDKNLELFDAVDKVTQLLSQRSEIDLLDDAGSNVRWEKYKKLFEALDRVQKTTGIGLK